jgi:knotted carbamoyltransferase YgeW
MSAWACFKNIFTIKVSTNKLLFFPFMYLHVLHKGCMAGLRTKLRFILPGWRKKNMNTRGIQEQIEQLSLLNTKKMFLDDFLLTWDRSDNEIAAVFKVAKILMNMRKKNISTRAFDSGLAISLFRDNSTRTRFSYASASNMLGLNVQDLDEGKSQIAHGETVRETANMVSFMADVIGIRDDMYIGKGNAYMREVAASVSQGYEAGILEQRPTLVNLQCDIDHPTQSMADALHLIQHFGGIDKLKGKKIAMSWAYSPSYGKPLSVPQGIVGLMTRFGMDVVLAHPEGYSIMPEVEEIANKNAEISGGSFTKTNSMADVFKDADIVYPKSWASFNAMEKRTDLYGNNDMEGIKALEKELLAQNTNFKEWECTETLMDLTRDKSALYMHCLPADITGVSCEQGEVAASVFDRYRDPLYVEASYKPYAIAAMIFLAKFSNPSEKLMELLKRDGRRIL